MTKQATASAPISASAGAAKAPASQTRSPGSDHRAEQPEVDQQLAHEAVERRQAADRDRADQERQPRPRHRFSSPPSRSIWRVPVACSTEPALRNSSALNRPWFHTWSSAPPSPSATRSARPSDRPITASPRPDADDADVLDAVIGEQALEVVLADGEGDAEHRRDHAEAEHETAPPQRRVREERADAHQAVDAHLDEHARHERRHVARRVGVRARQPDVQRHQAGLEPEAGQAEQEDRRRQPGVRQEA